jgi:hypothetical protein
MGKGGSLPDNPRLKKTRRSQEGGRVWPLAVFSFQLSVNSTASRNANLLSIDHFREQQRNVTTPPGRVTYKPGVKECFVRAIGVARADEIP